MFQPALAKSIRVHEHEGTFYGLCADPDTSRLYAGSTDGTIYVYDGTGEKLPPLTQWQAKHENYVVSLAYVRRPQGENVISASYDGTLTWWDAPSGGAIRRIDAHQGWVRQVQVTPDGARTVSVGDDMLIQVWDTDSRENVHTLAGHAKATPQGFVSALYALAISADGQWLASGDRVGEVRVWNLDQGREVARFQAPEVYTFDPRARKRSIGGIRSLAFSPDGRHLAVGGIGKVGNVDGLEGLARLELWDWQGDAYAAGQEPTPSPTRSLVVETSGHKSILNAVQFDRSGQWLLGAGGGGSNGLLCFWNVSNWVARGAMPEPSPNQESTRPSGEADKPKEVPEHRHKFDGHAHAVVWNQAQHRLYVAGYHKLEAWDLTGEGATASEQPVPNEP